MGSLIIDQVLILCKQTLFLKRLLKKGFKSFLYAKIKP
jgi:hypothetical protein